MMDKFFLFIILLASSAQSAELYEVNQSIRALGMGNAFSALAVGRNALSYNPAGLARTQGLNWTIFGINLGANGLDAYQTAKDFQDAANFEDALRSAFGDKIWVGAGGVSAFTAPGFGGSIYDTVALSANLTNPALPTFNLGLINDFGVNFGLGFEMAPGLAIGVVVSRIQRLGSTVPLGVETLSTVNATDVTDAIMNRGVGYGFDVGSSFTAPTPMKPTFSFVWKNMGYTRFTQESGSRAPPEIPDEMIAGFAMEFDLPGLDIRPAVDYKYMNREEIQITKKIHFGVEFDFPVFAVRAGFNQGYYTLGAGVNLGLIHLDLATYGVELGEYAGQQEDRRYVLEFSIDLGFDPGFGGSGNGKKGGGSRGVKQRR